MVTTGVGPCPSVAVPGHRTSLFPGAPSAPALSGLSRGLGARAVRAPLPRPPEAAARAGAAGRVQPAPRLMRFLWSVVF